MIEPGQNEHRGGSVARGVARQVASRKTGIRLTWILRSINPVREGQKASRNGRVPALAADAGQPDGQPVGQHVLFRLEAALDPLPGRTVGWE